MRRRRMKWSTSTTILLLLLIPILLVVHGENGDSLGLELVHRHDARRSGASPDRLEAVRGFVRRDGLRRQRMNQRWGIVPNDHRRKDREITVLPSFEMPMQAGRDYGLGEYFVEVEVGTPGQRFWLVADTGNEMTWFNCLHRNHSVGHQNHINHHRHNRKKHHNHKRSSGSRRTRTRTKTKRRHHHHNHCNEGVFCPHRSSSFETVTCSSQKCKVDLSDSFSLSYCPRPHNPCLYDISYVDGSSAKGFFGTDTISLDLTNGKKSKLDLTIGCTRSILNGITFNEGTGGVLGLGYAKDSFVDRAALQYGGKFSYCLVDHLSHKNVSSHLTFGNTSNSFKILGEIKKTELIVVPPLYGVNVVGVSIGGTMLKIPPQVWDFGAQGGTLIDSGTTLTTLIDLAYVPVLEALNKSLSNVKRVNGEDFGVLEFCFDGEGFDEGLVPRLVFHFAGGARFEPPVKSYIIDVAPQVKCIGIVESIGPGASVIGNIMQQNYVWEFDLAHNTLGFAPSTCTD